MSNRIVCVIRPVRGLDQYIPIDDAVTLNPGENAYIGEFDLDTEKDGPSKSHERRIGLPVGTLNTVPVTACVLRNLSVEGEDVQYVPVKEAGELVDGERLFTGLFSGQKEQHGPSRSHMRMVCLPIGRVIETTYHKAA
jgi:hypothetical protein